MSDVFEKIGKKYPKLANLLREKHAQAITAEVAISKYALAKQTVPYKDESGKDQERVIVPETVTLSGDERADLDIVTRVIVSANYPAEADDKKTSVFSVVGQNDYVANQAIDKLDSYVRNTVGISEDNFKLFDADTYLSSMIAKKLVTLDILKGKKVFEVILIPNNTFILDSDELSGVLSAVLSKQDEEMGVDFKVIKEQASHDLEVFNKSYDLKTLAFLSQQDVEKYRELKEFKGLLDTTNRLA